MEVRLETTGLTITLHSFNGHIGIVDRTDLDLTVKEFKQLPDIDGLYINKSEYSVSAIRTVADETQLGEARDQILASLKKLVSEAEKIRSGRSYVTIHAI